jgi:SAM-dependent methyltransferase
VNETVTSCPLCHDDRGRPLKQIPFQAIWRALETQRGVKLGSAIIERHTPADTTELRECDSCGLRYFAPSNPGDADFYEALGAEGYYESFRWEFGVCADHIQPDDDVLDIGCGQGDFLRSIKDRPGRTVGLDHNPTAIARLNSQGIEGYAARVAQLVNVEAESFDVVCAFQILEHVSSADHLVTSAVELLRPGGRLLISVPNRDRYAQNGLEPLDHPPHHLSRWSRDQFVALAERYGLELTSVDFEEPDFAAAEAYWFETVRRRTARVLGSRGGLLGARAARRYWVSPGRYERAAARKHFTRRRVCGHTLLAQLRLSPDSNAYGGMGNPG